MNHEHTAPHPAAEALFDPVCGMSVDPAKAGPDTTETWQGRTFYFCCSGCRDTFRGDPEQYANHPAAPFRPKAQLQGGHDHQGHVHAAPAPDATYTCPMHPE